MASRTIREVTFDLLRELGMTTIFGNPGSTEETFLKDFPEDFRYIQTLHESSAVGAADGYAQATRKPALVNVHTSAGLSNSMSNIMTAAMNKTPLIITAGNQTREMLLMEPWLMNVEPTILPKPWVKWSYQPVRAEDLPAAFMRAYAVALQPPAGPVFLSIPLDDCDKPATGPAVVRSIAKRIGPDPEGIAAFADALSAAGNPVLIYGSGIARAEGWETGIRLAEKLNVKVWAAPASERTPFPENHPLYAGGLPFAIGPLSKKLEGHDLAIVIGAPVFRYYPYIAGQYIPDGLRLLHITDDPSESGRAPVGDSLLSDPVLALEELLARVKPRQAASGDISKQEHRMAPYPAAKTPEKKPDSAMSSLELFQILRASTPDNTILVEESPSSGIDSILLPAAAAAGSCLQVSASPWLSAIAAETGPLSLLSGMGLSSIRFRDSGRQYSTGCQSFLSWPAMVNMPFSNPLQNLKILRVFPVWICRGWISCLLPGDMGAFP